MKKVLLLTCLLLTPLVFAEGQTKKTENLLDFEGDVIEGEKKRPDLFLDLKSSDIQMDELIYLRPDFNDFFAIDKKQRTRFVK